MKKLFLSLVAALTAATATFAQSTLVATLSHGEDISMYYGTNALRDAVNAAVSGDVINLSGGTFQGVGIYKAITVRGTGIDDANPTYIINDFGVDVPDTEPGLFQMEGIRCPNRMYIGGGNSNTHFSKCWIYWIDDMGGVSAKNILFANCKITYRCQIYDSPITMQFVNCYIKDFVNGKEGSGATFVNCVLKNGYATDFKNSYFANCIITSVYSSFPSSCIASNCVGVGNNALFSGSPSNTNCRMATYAELFKDYTGEYSDAQTFELTDEAKTTYLGNDSTEVGLYGGSLPYTSTPSYPQITKMNVANKTTADGKLSVEIEVSAAQ